MSLTGACEERCWGAGGYVSDRYLGKYRTILYLSFGYCIGHAILAAWETSMGTYLGLAAIAIGAGGIKPCVTGKYLAQALLTDALQESVQQPMARLMTAVHMQRHFIMSLS